MKKYSRPVIQRVEFRDDEENVLDYGNRWADREGPPDDSYSVIDHPERFAPLQSVTEALIDYLSSNYDVDVDEGTHVTSGLMHAPKVDEIVRAVQITPRAEASAPIVFVLTNYPGVRVDAGVLFNTRFPSCPCNACDEAPLDVAAELEWQTLSIAGRGFTEEVSEPRRAKWSYDRGKGFTLGMGQTVSHRLRNLDDGAEQSGQSRAEDVPTAMLDKARTTLNVVAAASTAGNWQPWPRR